MENYKMDINKIYDIRRQSLQQLVDKTHSGNTAEFARAHGFDENRIRHLLRRERNFGEKAARMMEEQCKLPDFYFDIAGAKGESAAILISEFIDLDDQERAEILRHLELLKRDRIAEKA